MAPLPPGEAFPPHSFPQVAPMPQFTASCSHIGLCVADLERARRFYREALGFAEEAVFAVENTINDLLGIPDNVVMTSQMMRHGNLVIELIHFSSPATISGGLRAMNQLGLTHLSFVVDDVDIAAAHLEACGGAVLRDTRTVFAFPDADPTILIFCTDPDGTRIELYRPSSSLAAG